MKPRVHFPTRDYIKRLDETYGVDQNGPVAHSPEDEKIAILLLNKGERIAEKYRVARCLKWLDASVY